MKQVTLNEIVHRALQDEEVRDVLTGPWGEVQAGLDTLGLRLSAKDMKMLEKLNQQWIKIKPTDLLDQLAAEMSKEGLTLGPKPWAAVRPWTGITFIKPVRKQRKSKGR